MMEKRGLEPSVEQTELPEQPDLLARSRVVRAQESAEDPFAQSERQNLLRKIMDIDAQIEELEEESDLAEEVLVAYEDEKRRRQTQSIGWFARMRVRMFSSKRAEERLATGLLNRAKTEELKRSNLHALGELYQLRGKYECLLPMQEWERREGKRAKIHHANKEIEKLRQDIYRQQHEVEGIRLNEEKKLSDFFEKTIIVPPVPITCTAARIQEWRSKGFALHYFPDEDMSTPKNQALKNWTKRLGVDQGWYGDIIRRGGSLSSDFFVLSGGWFLINTSKKSKSNKRGVVKQEGSGYLIVPILLSYYAFYHDRSYRHSWCDVGRFRYEVAQALDVDLSAIKTPTLLTMNLLAHIHEEFRDWGDTPGDEFMKDYVSFYRNTQYLVSGDSEHGGASHIGYALHNLDDMYGFRPMVRIS